MSKLLIPTVTGIIMVIPVSVYFGSLYNGYTGSFLTFWLDFFTNWLPNLESCKIIGSLWFLLYLFIASLVALPIIMKYIYGNWRIPLEKVTILKFLLMIIPLALGTFFRELYPEKSIFQFFLLFIFGYFLLSDDSIQEKLEARRWPLFISFVAITIFYLLISVPNIDSTVSNSNTTTFTFYSLLGQFIMKLFENSIMWLGVLGVMGMGKHYLEFKKPKKKIYLSAVSFPIFIFHIAWINLLAYYIIMWIPNLMVFQVILIMGLSFAFTLATIVVVRRIKGFRFIFGIRG